MSRRLSLSSPRLRFSNPQKGTVPFLRPAGGVLPSMDASRRTGVNSIKNLLVIAVLLGVAYAVYTTISSTPRRTHRSASRQVVGGARCPGPRGTGSKVGRFRNPFASGGSKTATSVTARDPSALGGLQSSPKDIAERPRWSTTADRFSQPPSQPDARSNLSSEAAPPWGASDSRPVSPRVGEHAPGLATSSDIPVTPPPITASGLPEDKGGTARTSATGSVRKDLRRSWRMPRNASAAGSSPRSTLALSRLYGDPDLTAEETRRLTELLDQLAGTVIYSRRPCLTNRPTWSKPANACANRRELQCPLATFG